MNKDLYDTLAATEKELNGKLDPESKRFLERSLLERKLDGMLANTENKENK